MNYRNILVLSAAAGLLGLTAAGQAAPPAVKTPPAIKTPPAATAPPAAQAPPPVEAKPAEEAKQPEPLQEDRTAYIRRFSLGGRVHALGMGLIRVKDATENLTVGPTEIKAKGEGKSVRTSVGVTMQVMLTDRIGFGVDLMRKKVGYMETLETRVGTDNASTAVDDRKLTTTVEQTRATIWELPVVGRYYNTGRFEEGWRWFIEAGAAARRSGKVVTFTKVDDTCCQQIPRAPTHRFSTGIVAGGGIQAMDAYGIKVMPGVRYIWWPSRTFDLRSAKSSRHQVEVGVAITF